jgi:hypothetical protein
MQPDRTERTCMASHLPDARHRLIGPLQTLIGYSMYHGYTLYRDEDASTMLALVYSCCNAGHRQIARWAPLQITWQGASAPTGIHQDEPAKNDGWPGFIQCVAPPA